MIRDKNGKALRVGDMVKAPNGNVYEFCGTLTQMERITEVHLASTLEKVKVPRPKRTRAGEVFVDYIIWGE